MEHSTPSLPAAEPEATTPNWSLTARLAYRFAASYFIVFLVPRVLLWPLDLLGASWLGVSPSLMNPRSAGSGDRTVDWVHALTVLILAVAGTVVWSVLDRKRREYTTALAWTRLAMRYVLASVMLSYGLAKVFPMQFQPPTDGRLVQRFGDFSPMGLLWSFMGASMGYTIFSGAMEVLGGLLLLFRRTAVVGALFTAAVMANVVALNMFYDVPVKLLSFHWLAFALVIAAPDLARLFRFLVLQKAVDPPFPAGPVFTKRHWRIVSWVGKASVLALLIIQVQGAHTRYASRPRPQQRLILGAYRVEGFPGWQEVEVENAASMRVTRDDGTITRYRLVNSGQSRLQLHDSAGRPAGSFSFRTAGVLEGDVNGEPTLLQMVASPETFLLQQRGFHWINEVPFNR